jgi:hypothetical protein
MQHLDLSDEEAAALAISPEIKLVEVADPIAQRGRQNFKTRKWRAS